MFSKIYKIKIITYRGNGISRCIFCREGISNKERVILLTTDWGYQRLHYRCINGLIRKLKMNIYEMTDLINTINKFTKDNKLTMLADLI